MTTTYTMQVEFKVNDDQEIEVRTDGSLMGRYTSFLEAGRDLGDEFRYRLKAKP